MAKKLKVVVLPGDGIGPEVTIEAVKVLKAVEDKISVEFELIELPEKEDIRDEKGKKETIDFKIEPMVTIALRKFLKR